MADQLSGLGTITNILTIEPDWKSRKPKANYLLSRDVLEFEGTSQKMYLNTEERPARFDCQFAFVNKTEEYAISNFFYQRKGQLNLFWFPCPVDLFFLSENAVAGQNNLKVTKNTFNKKYRGYERLYIKKRNGDLLTFKITGVEETTDNLTLSIDSALNENLNISEIVFFSLLYLSRFDTDEFEPDYKTMSHGVVSLSIHEQVREYPA